MPAEATYPSVLQGIIDERADELDYQWRVENWGAAAAIGHDYIVLAAKAIHEKPDVVLVVTFAENYETERNSHKLTYSDLDIPYIAGELGVFSRLPVSFVSSYMGIEGTLNVAARRKSYLIRNSQHVWELLEAWTQEIRRRENRRRWRAERGEDEPRSDTAERPSFRERFLKYMATVDFALLYGKARSADSTFWFQPISMEAINRRKQWMQWIASNPDEARRHERAGSVFSSLDEFDPSYLVNYDFIEDRSEETKVVFVLMPLCRTLLNDDAPERVDRFNEVFKSHFRQKEIPVWDYTWAIEPTGFVSYSHMFPDSHEAFAQMLYDRLLEEEVIR
jgi:hypothetical protein